MTGVMPWLAAAAVGAQNPCFCYYGQTVGDMNKRHYTDPHKLESAYPMEIGLP